MDSAKIWFFIINPNAGGQRAEILWPKLQEALVEANIAHEFARSLKRYHATKLVKQALQDGFRKFAVVGGDGTVNEVVNGFFQQNEVAIANCVITVIPCGTGND